MTDDATWLESDGCTWTLSTRVARMLCECDALTPAELYFVLMSLNILERFRECWDRPAFYKKAGIADQAVESQRRSSNRCEHGFGESNNAHHDWLLHTGDHLWVAGKTGEARQHYQRCIDEAGGREFLISAGIGGLTRLHFVQGEFIECVAAFRFGCIPSTFLGRPYFLPETKYMCRAIVAAALRAGGIDAELRKMLVEYFEIESAQLDVLAKTLNKNDDAIARLQKQVAPKAAISGATFNSLWADGNTEMARKVRDRLPHCNTFVHSATKLLDDYLDSGNDTFIDEMIEAGSPFGIAQADAMVLAKVMDSRMKKLRMRLRAALPYFGESIPFVDIRSMIFLANTLYS